MDREELVRKYAGGEKDFTGRRFRNSNWIDEIVRGGIYREADFSNAYFVRSGFDEADLSFAKFVRARMYESGFGSTCCLEGIDFTYAVFSQCNFSEVDLRGAIFRNATLSEVNFRNANLSYADLRGARKLTVGSCENAIFYETIMPNGRIYTA
ncbi:MAG: pentapeptide repeat-containing protein [Kastovskya adunca ATA6-11-RM4]|nr:pentapeptide repeat-containing protein [Kastovskya adunca ATA6-11-RM4]